MFLNAFKRISSAGVPSLQLVRRLDIITSEGGGLYLDGSALASAELGYIDGVTAGTVTASKALVVDANSAIGSFALSGRLTTGTLAGSSVSMDATTWAYSEGLELRYVMSDWADGATTHTSAKGMYLRMENTEANASGSIYGAEIYGVANNVNTQYVTGGLFYAYVKGTTAKTITGLYAIQPELSFDAGSGTNTIAEACVVRGKVTGGVMAAYTNLHGYKLIAGDMDGGSRTYGNAFWVVDDGDMSGTCGWTVGLNLAAACTTAISVGGAFTTGISIAADGTTAISVTSAFSGTTGFSFAGTATDGINISGICGDAIEISGAATTTGINISADCQIGITIAGQTTSAIKFSTGGGKIVDSAASLTICGGDTARDDLILYGSSVVTSRGTVMVGDFASSYTTPGQAGLGIPLGNATNPDIRAFVVAATDGTIQPTKRIESSCHSFVQSMDWATTTYSVTALEGVFYGGFDLISTSDNINISGVGGWVYLNDESGYSTAGTAPVIGTASGCITYVAGVESFVTLPTSYEIKANGVVCGLKLSNCFKAPGTNTGAGYTYNIFTETVDAVGYDYFWGTNAVGNGLVANVAITAVNTAYALKIRIAGTDHYIPVYSDLSWGS